jgi:L-ascorbate metabolism protein UlaG (beta-lactamase superfamily)
MSKIAPVDVALLPVAGWGPRLPAGHLDPAGAAEALRLLRPKAAVPIHWGTLWRLFADRPNDRPAREFVRIARELAPEVDVRVLSIGETLPLPELR